MDDVWELETLEQVKKASDYINYLYEQAIHGKVSSRNMLKRIYDGDNWDTIKERMNTEGSCWFVWYMDGVNNLISMSR